MGKEESGLKLAFIKKRFSPHGGAELYLQTMLDQVRRAGHEIHILANEWSDTEGVTFHKVPVLPFGSFLSSASFDRNVRRVLSRGINPDYTVSFERTTCQDIYRAGDGCHAEWLMRRSVAEPWWKRLTFGINPLHRTLLSLERRIFRDTPVIIANSDMVKKQIVSHYRRPAGSIVTIYNGVDLQRFSPLSRDSFRGSVRGELSIGGKTKALLFVGSGFERKGLGTLLKALALLKPDRASGLKTVLLVAGRGNTRKFGTAASSLGVRERVFFLGPRQDMERFYAAADVFVLPTLYDPFSNATLEAMSCGLPVVTTEGNGASEIVSDGVEGFVLRDPLDHRELAAAAERACAGAEAMGERARRKAEQYPIERAAAEFMEVLNSLRAGIYGKLS